MRSLSVHVVLWAHATPQNPLLSGLPIASTVGAAPDKPATLQTCSAGAGNHPGEDRDR